MGVGSSGAVVSCLGGDGGRTPPLILEYACDGESFQHKDTRVPSEPRYELRKITHSQQQENSVILLIHKFEKLSIHEMNEENLSKKIKESVDSSRLSFPPSPIIF